MKFNVSNDPRNNFNVYGKKQGGNQETISPGKSKSFDSITTNIELQVWMDATAPGTTKWNFTFDNTAPRTVNVDIGGD